MRSRCLPYMPVMALSLGVMAHGQTQPTTPDIALKRIGPVRVVYVEHKGPYWTVGPQLDRLKIYMLEHGEHGPLFTRYLDYPATSSEAAARVEIGFVTTSGHKARSPYRTAQRDGELVASMRVASPLARPPRYYRIMARWLSTNGQTAAGPLTEVYPSGDTGVAADQPIEIQLVVAPSQREDEVMDPPQTVATERVKPMAEEKSGATLPPPLTGRRHARIDATELEHFPFSHTGSTALRDTSNSEKPRGLRPAPRNAETGNALVAVPVVGPPDHPATLGELLAERRFEQAAKRLLPDERVVPTVHQLWLGQLVFRVSAVARGVTNLFPGEAQDVAEWSTALRGRYEAISGGFGHDPLAPAVVSADMDGDPSAPRKRAIMRDLDRILGQLAWRTINPAEVTAQLNKIMQRTQGVLSRETPND